MLAHRSRPQRCHSMTGFDFTGRHILVTGASRGIGYAVAQGFAAHNATLSILADDSAIDAAAARIGAETGRTVTALRCDIADRDQVAAALAPLDRIDVLVNNAGLELITPLDGGAAVSDIFRRIIDINVNGTFHVTQAALPKMRKGAAILVTASIWSKTAVAGFSAYCASKHAVLGFARSIAQELGPRGIRVNAICPGF